MERDVAMSEELWKTIKGFEGLYEVSTLGRVRSIERVVVNRRNREMKIKETILKPENVYNGYERVFLCKNGKGVHKRVATLVYESFIGAIPEGLEIDHTNGERTDNRVENLRAVTHLENCRNPISRAKHLAANQRRSRTLKEYWRKKKAASTL